MKKATLDKGAKVADGGKNARKRPARKVTKRLPSPLLVVKERALLPAFAIILGHTPSLESLRDTCKTNRKIFYQRYLRRNSSSPSEQDKKKEIIATVEEAFVELEPHWRKLARLAEEAMIGLKPLVIETAAEAKKRRAIAPPSPAYQALHTACKRVLGTVPAGEVLRTTKDRHWSVIADGYCAIPRVYPGGHPLAHRNEEIQKERERRRRNRISLFNAVVDVKFEWRAQGLIGDNSESEEEGEKGNGEYVDDELMKEAMDAWKYNPATALKAGQKKAAEEREKRRLEIPYKPTDINQWMEKDIKAEKMEEGETEDEKTRKDIAPTETLENSSTRTATKSEIKIHPGMKWAGVRWTVDGQYHEVESRTIKFNDKSQLETGKLVDVEFEGQIYEAEILGFRKTKAEAVNLYKLHWKNLTVRERRNVLAGL